MLLSITPCDLTVRVKLIQPLLGVHNDIP